MAPNNEAYEARDLTTISYRKRQLVMYPVQEQEFDILASGYSSIHLALFGCFLGASVTMGVTLASVQVPEQVATRFWVGLFVFGGLSLYCGLMAVRDYKKSRDVLATIKAETVNVVITNEQHTEKPKPQE